MSDFTGTPGDDHLNGGEDRDIFDIGQGGADTVKGGGGNDGIDAYAAFGADDRINGGTGEDTLTLDGDYSAGVVFAAATLTHVEHIELAAGHSYALTLSDKAAATADGRHLQVGASGFDADQHIVIDGSAIQAGRSLDVTLGDNAAASTLIGGAGDDTLTFDGPGRFDVTGGDGSDTVALYRPMTLNDHFHGGAGDNDTVVMLSGQSTVLTGTMIDDVETLWVYGGDYAITMRDTAVAAGKALNVYAGDLEAGQHLAFDGSREHDATFSILAGADTDTLTGGRGGDRLEGAAGDDLITGGKGGDLLLGREGADSFVYGALSDSSRPGQFDLIGDLEDADTIDLSAIDARTDKAGDQAFTQVDAFSGHAGELVLKYDADSDTTTLALDVDGDARADMKVHIAGDHEGFSHFVL